jgi:hypothetical protein
LSGFKGPLGDLLVVRVGGAILGDLRSFVQVLKFIQDPIIMIPPRTGSGWGREGFGTRRLGRGDDRGGHQGYAW